MAAVPDSLTNDPTLLGTLSDSPCSELDVMVMGDNDNEKEGMDSASTYPNSMKTETLLVSNLIDTCSAR